MRKNQKGFSLIELLIVVAMILIVAAIAIPNLMSARMSANESSAAGSLRTINTAEIIIYAYTYPDVGFTAMASLGGAQPCTPSPATGCFIDDFLASNGGGNGKDDSSTPQTAASLSGYGTLAAPLTSTGTRAFCSDQTGVLYYNG